VGDVVTYLGKEGDLKGKIVTHKVVEVSADQTRIVTKGVANQIADPEITPADIRAVMVKKTVVIGAIYSVVTTTWGFILLVILPMVIMIGSEIIHLIRIMRSEGEDGEEEQSNN
jgi:signal peptidase I